VSILLGSPIHSLRPALVPQAPRSPNPWRSNRPGRLRHCPKEEEGPHRFAVRSLPSLVIFRSFLVSCQPCRKPPRICRFLRSNPSQALFQI
jgi:hypothetical protein